MGVDSTSQLPQDFLEIYEPSHIISVSMDETNAKAFVLMDRFGADHSLAIQFPGGLLGSMSKRKNLCQNMTNIH